MEWTDNLTSRFSSHNLGLAVTRRPSPKSNPFQMGLLALMGNLPLLLVGIAARAGVDHMPYQRVLITADVGRAFLISSIPVTAWLRVLSLTQLYVVAFLIGVLTVFFDVGYQSFLSSLVERDQLVSANSKLESGTALASVVSPGLACRYSRSTHLWPICASCRCHLICHLRRLDCRDTRPDSTSCYSDHNPQTPF